MNNKLLGIFIFILSIAIAIVIVIFNTQIDDLISQQMISSGGSCFDEAGNCLHEKNQIPMYLGIVLVLLTFTLSVYVFFFGENTEVMFAQQTRILREVSSAKRSKAGDEKFGAVLSALEEDEKIVLKSVREQDGISQNTLRLRTDLSKTKLSMILTKFEGKNLVKKVKKGKINLVYLKNKY